ncbi:monosaccharide ABC transporter substrate-binding protein, CUT2 family [Paraburkholderia fungorum]|uniref:Monosaccharide ABC transporter substrate-binding protein, CUT2 family n=1 Tax=Paraburkholderia fungorum TaxID=134537 RepID=A0A1H1JRT2_9BURK|nr:sugar ABC transporter substrate-binding protein [Paraburkholderia fungorum]SDR52630.1 monosaccharide ABC transporter substrate-binding protein, CUT2 family [Paraburkholderia fungorum]
MTFVSKCAVLLSAAMTLMSAGASAATPDANFQLAPAIKAQAAAKTKPTFVVSYHDPALSVAAPMRKGVGLAAKELNVNAVFTGPVGGGAEKQVAELENWITKGVDGIAVSSSSTDALAPVINKAIAAGIPVVTFNTDNPASHRLSFVGQDLAYSGVVMGDTLVKHMGQKGKVLVFTVDAAAEWSKDREKGLRQSLAKYPNIAIVGLVNTSNEPQQIYAAIENAMLAHQDVTGIVSLDCCSFPAIGQYLQRNGLAGKIPVVGSDLLPQTKDLIKGGALTATISQNPQRQGHDAVVVLNQIFTGAKMPDSHTDTGVQVIDRASVDQHAAE